MASIVMFLRALMSCRLTPIDEPETAETALSTSAVKIYRNVVGDESTTSKRVSVVDISHLGDRHEFIMGPTRGIKDMEEGSYWIVIENHSLI